MSNDPIESASKGATSAVLEWSEQKVRDLVKQFQNRKLAFIKNAENIELVKRQRESSEFSILKQFVPKGAYAIQIQMGLALRDIQDSGERVEERVLELGDKIIKKYGLAGLHVAETTKIGITAQLLTRLADIYNNPADVTKKLTYFFDHIEDVVIFVKKKDDPKVVARTVILRIEQSPYHIMVLFGSGYAKDILVSALREIKSDTRGYVIDARQEKLQIMAFIYTPEIRAKISDWSESF